jgi:hypothetical protein
MYFNFFIFLPYRVYFELHEIPLVCIKTNMVSEYLNLNFVHNLTERYIITNHKLTRVHIIHFFKKITTLRNYIKKKFESGHSHPFGHESSQATPI